MPALSLFSINMVLEILSMIGPRPVINFRVVELLIVRL
jgi:hypothetical protein